MNNLKYVDKEENIGNIECPTVVYTADTNKVHFCEKPFIYINGGVYDEYCVDINKNVGSYDCGNEGGEIWVYVHSSIGDVSDFEFEIYNTSTEDGYSIEKATTFDYNFETGQYEFKEHNCYKLTIPGCGSGGGISCSDLKGSYIIISSPTHKNKFKYIYDCDIWYEDRYNSDFEF